MGWGFADLPMVNGRKHFTLEYLPLAECVTRTSRDERFNAVRISEHLPDQSVEDWRHLFSWAILLPVDVQLGETRLNVLQLFVAALILRLVAVFR